MLYPRTTERRVWPQGSLLTPTSSAFHTTCSGRWVDQSASAPSPSTSSGYFEQRRWRAL
ncbi:unnamed protein product [Dibothriocephalus latus]|uniref:Uncharacterized protein n=1 Tax=Dibothriocephalus latus TaxID=60516 RepID=A0A3P7QLA6_DIBLA|nr:unnamed protein product [Dibothriocephalus latus]